jgi:hypothetical protein
LDDRTLPTPDDRPSSPPDATAPPESAGNRRPLHVWRVVLLFVVIAIVTSLLGAEPLHSSAEALSPSFLRTAAVSIIGPLAAVSDFLRLDKPWQWATTRATGSGEARPGATLPESAEPSAGGADNTGGGPSAGTTDVSTSTPTTASPTTTTSPPTSSTTTTSTTEAEPVFTAEEPLRVLVVGDSMMLQIGSGLVRQSERLAFLRVKVQTKVSSGLVRPDFFDWPSALGKALTTFQPHVTVMLFGGNERQNMTHEGRSLPPFSEAWTAEYLARVEGAIAQATGGGRVIWIGMPIMRSQAFSKTVRSLNAIYRDACARNENATYLDGYTLFADSQGEYAPYLEDSSGKRRLVREGDGIHLTQAGGDRAAEAVVRLLLEFYKFEP